MQKIAWLLVLLEDPGGVTAKPSAPTPGERTSRHEVERERLWQAGQLFDFTAP